MIYACMDTCAQEDGEGHARITVTFNEVSYRTASYLQIDSDYIYGDIV